jgi:hypothetical protein
VGAFRQPSAVTDTTREPSEDRAKTLALFQISSQKVGKSSYSVIWSLTLINLLRIKLAGLKYLLMPTAYFGNEAKNKGLSSLWTCESAEVSSLL